MFQRKGIIAAVIGAAAGTAYSDVFLVQAQGVQDPKLHPGFWSVSNESDLDVVRVDLDLPGEDLIFDADFGVIVHTVVGADPDDITFSFPGDNGDNLRVAFEPGSFPTGAEVTFYADVDNWVFSAADMIGIAVTLTFADGSLTSDVFRNVDPSPCFDFGPDGAGAAFGDDCRADCNDDGVLNILDFPCYQAMFLAGDLCADCNADGALDILDFMCFQVEFQAGCP